MLMIVWKIRATTNTEYYFFLVLYYFVLLLYAKIVKYIFNPRVLNDSTNKWNRFSTLRKWMKNKKKKRLNASAVCLKYEQ